MAALVFFVLWASVSQQPVVEMKVDGTTCYFTEPNFELRWIHSVEKQWWEEQYQRLEKSSTEDAMLLLTTTYFEAFGAGTPSTEPLAPIQKPGYLGYQINETLPSLNWVVSRLTKGELNYADHRLLIHEWAPDYSEVTVTPKTYHLIDRLQKDFCHELASDGSR